MININLLPADRKKKGVQLSKLYLLCMYAMLGLTLLVWAYSLISFKYDQYKLAKVQDALAGMSVWEERYNLNQTQNALLNRRKNIITSLSKNRVSWSDTLATLGNITPYGCWISSINQDNNNTGSFTVSGKALKMEQVLAFVHSLQQDPNITSVSLGETKMIRLTNAAAHDAVEFNVSYNRIGGVVANAK